MPWDDVMEGVHEYAEMLPVSLVPAEKYKKAHDRWLQRYPEEYKSLQDSDYIVVARNEAGCNCTMVNLREVIEWVRKHKPELLE